MTARSERRALPLSARTTWPTRPAGGGHDILNAPLAPPLFPKSKVICAPPGICSAPRDFNHLEGYVHQAACGWPSLAGPPHDLGNRAHFRRLERRWRLPRLWHRRLDADGLRDMLDSNGIPIDGPGRSEGRRV